MKKLEEEGIVRRIRIKGERKYLEKEKGEKKNLYIEEEGRIIEIK